MVERIKRAMDLARQERLGAGSQAAAAGLHSAATSRVVAAAPPPPGVEGAHGSITVSQATLQAARLLQPGMVGDAAHGFRLLRTQVLRRMAQRGWNTLAILSPGPNEGKTYTAINLGVAISAHRDSTALVVDLDLRCPRVHRRLGFVPKAGIEDCLRGEAALGDVILSVEGYPGLTLLPARGPVEHSSELISNATARRVFRDIKERYANRIVVYDLPPVLATDDALAFVPQVDAALMVVGEGRTKREDLLRCLELLRDTPILGTVLNGSHGERSAEYAY